MEVVSISIGKAALIGLWFYYSGSCFTGGVGGYTISKPLIGGTIVGLILGKPLEGMKIGAQISVLYIGFISAGGAQAADPNMAGTLGTALALASGLDASAAVLLAVPLGLIGNLRLMLRLVVNSPITHISEKFAKSANYKMLFLSNVILPQSLYFCTGFFPVFLACIYGPNVVSAAVANLPVWAMNGLNLIGGMLPALGICVNLKNIGKPNTLPFFFVGFLLYQYLAFSNVVIAVIGAIVAYIAVFGVKPRALSEAQQSVLVEDKASVINTKARKQISKKQLRKAFLNWLFFSHSCYNYERLQGISFGQSMFSCFKDLYDSKQKIGEEMEKHTVFFNTEPNVGTIIHGVVCAMEEERANNPDDIVPEAINAVKTGLMGPFAGIGDTIVQGILTPLFLSIAIGMAMEGNFIAPLFHVICNGGCIITINYFMWMYGYKWGRDAVTKILEGGLMDSLLLAASILGCFVMGALVALNVKVFTPLSIQLAAATAKEPAKLMFFQGALFDAIIKGVLPMGTTLFTFRLVKKGWSANKIMGLLSLLGFVLGALGILSNAAPKMS